MIINRILGLLVITVVIAGLGVGFLLIRDMAALDRWNEGGMEVMICHQTGSSANPWRPMKVNPAEASHYLASGDQLADHEGQCPAESSHPAKGNVELCVYTGNKAESWVRMSVSPSNVGFYEARPYEGNCP